MGDLGEARADYAVEGARIEQRRPSSERWELRRLSNAVRRGPDRIIASQGGDDFGVGPRLCNLPALRQIGFGANRRILELEKLTHDCSIGRQSFQQPQQAASASRRCVLVTQEFRPSLPSW